MRLFLAACLCLLVAGCSSIVDMGSERGQRVYGGTRKKNVAWMQGEGTDTHDGTTERVLGVCEFPFSLALDTAFLPVTLIFALVRVNQWTLDR